MKQFAVKLDLRKRAEMIKFLAGHFRYNTMNSRNKTTSYACNIDAHSLELSNDITGRFHTFMQSGNFTAECNRLISEFNQTYGYVWQAGFNGHSDGYLVLYSGGRQRLEYKSYCTRCGQRNLTSVKDTGDKCGICGNDTRKDYDEPQYLSFMYTGKGTDENADYSGWSISELRDRVRLIRSFDCLADNIVKAAVYMAEHFNESGIPCRMTFVNETRIAS